MKRAFYIFCCIVLGIFLSSLLHALIEHCAIAYLLSDFDTFGLGLTWETWFAMHHMFSVVLFLLGIGGGYLLGVHWWRVVYERRKHGLVFGVK